MIHVGVNTRWLEQRKKEEKRYPTVCLRTKQLEKSLGKQMTTNFFNPK